MANATKEQVRKQGSAALISMTPTEITRVCAIAKGHEFMYTVPLSRIVHRVLEHSIKTVQTWEFHDISIETSEAIQFRFDDWFNYCDTGFEEMVLSLRFKNHEFGTTDTLEVDIIQVIRTELQALSRKLYIGGAEIRQGKKNLMVSGKEISLKNGQVQVLITTEEPCN